jgi:translation elongation factor P/translation initiation factor 5A
MTLRNPLVSLVLGVALLLGARAQAEMAVGDSVTVTTTVQSVDLKTREIDLKDADGKMLTMHVPENIKNLDKVKVGDTITTTYAVAVAVEIMKPGDTPAPITSSAMKQGGGEVVGATQHSAMLKVDSVDLAANTVTVTGPKGNQETLKVKRPEVQERLKTLKAGDEVQVTYTEAMAIKVTPKK